MIRDKNIVYILMITIYKHVNVQFTACEINQIYCECKLLAYFMCHVLKQDKAEQFHDTILKHFSHEWSRHEQDQKAFLQMLLQQTRNGIVMLIQK